MLVLDSACAQGPVAWTPRHLVLGSMETSGSRRRVLAYFFLSIYVKNRVTNGEKGLAHAEFHMEWVPSQPKEREVAVQPAPTRPQLGS